MKKKNVLMMALSLALVAVIAVGGTLAFLTSNTGTMTNTFKFGKLEIHQYESDKDAQSATDSGDMSYTNLVPNSVVNKEVKITLVNHHVNAYVYVAVKNSNSNLIKYGNMVEGDFVEGVTTNWMKVENTNPAINGYTLYVYKGADSAKKAVDSFENVVLFDKAQVQDYNGEQADTTIKIASYAIQADQMGDTNFDNEAAKYFNEYSWS